MGIIGYSIFLPFIIMELDKHGIELQWQNVRKLSLLERAMLFSAIYLKPCSPGDSVEPLNNDVVYGSINSPEYVQNKSTQSLAKKMITNPDLFGNNIESHIIERLDRIVWKEITFITQDDAAFIENLDNTYPRFRELLE